MSVAPTNNSTTQQKTYAAAAATGTDFGAGKMEAGSLPDNGKFRTVERVVCMRHSSTLELNDEKGATAAVWKPFDGKVAHVWAPTEFGIENNHETAVANLNNARVKSVTCLEYVNTFPISLGIKSDALPAIESTESGQRFVMTMLPNGRNNTPQVLYNCNNTSNEAVRWLSEYPEYTKRNLDTHNVMEVKSHPVVFVDKNHPVVALLRSNKDLLGSDISTQPLVHNRWHTVSKQVFNVCCNTLRTKVLSQVDNDVRPPHINFAITTLDKKPWCDIGIGEHIVGFKPDPNDPASIKNALTAARKAPYNVTARFKVVYDYPVS